MSGPNSDYDPVEVTPLKADEVEAMRDAALGAVAGATDLDDLKRVRSEHAGDRSPLALARIFPSGRKASPRWHWRTGRSARCRRRPARTPGCASARPAVR